MSTPLASSSRRPHRIVSLILASLLAVPVVLLASPASPTLALTVPPVASPTVGHVTADPLPTVQVNGVVWVQFVLGNTVYVGGEFTHARPAGSPPGVNQVPRSNLLAYNLTTGALVPGFAANANAEVRSITASPDGSRIYVSGLFTTVNGISRPRIAALNPTTGAVITSFNARTDYLVYDLVATNTVVYAGGKFARAGGTEDRMNLAAFSVTNGAVLPWAPMANDRVRSLALSPDGSTMYAAGAFSQMNGQSRRGLAAIDIATAAVKSISANNDVWAVGPDGSFLDLQVANGAIYGAGYTFGRDTGNLEGAFKLDAATGDLVWLEDCHGDTYQVFPINGYVYKASHQHFCANVGGTTQSDANQWSEHMRHASSFADEVSGTVRRDNWSYHNLEGFPTVSPTSWAPNWTKGDYTGLNQATWSVSGNSDYVVYGGEFTRVNNVPQQGIVRFAVRSIAPNDDGPRLSGTRFPLNVVSPAPGRVRVSFAANFDRDDHVLTYELLRNNVVVQSDTAASTYWDWPTVSFFETGLSPGQNLTYRVRARDASGNIANSPDYSVTVATSGTVSPYADQVVADGADIYWRLGDPVGSTTAADSAASSNGTVNQMTFGRPGAIVGDPNTAASPTGTSSRVVQPPTYTVDGGTAERNPVRDEFTVEGWFRSTGSLGGRILGFGSSNSGNSGSGQYDRHIYVSDSGRVVFGVRSRPPGSGASSSRTNYTIQSVSGLNNGQWHHVAATLSGDGMRLYVDGSLAAGRNDVNSGHGYYGYWRVGADTMSGWSPTASSARLNGDIDEAAVYYRALTPAQIMHHWILSGHASNQPPTAMFTATPTGLSVGFDGSGSSDVDGSIVSYVWNFGDGSSSTVMSPTHVFGAAGTYNVVLTVTDDDGASGVFSQPVTVAGSNQPPTASFTATPDGLSMEFDGSGSSDPDGSIVSYVWNFGDGSSSTDVSPTHVFGAAGTYNVVLTVTDDDGASGVLSMPVTVVASEAGVIARDTFGRSMVNGWGSADLGGAWTLAGTVVSDFAVVNGRGTMSAPVGKTRTAVLNSVSALDATSSVDLAWDREATGSGMYSSLFLRRVGSDSYYARVRTLPTSTVLSVMRQTGGVPTALSSVTLPMTYSPGDVWRLEFETEGTAPTTLRAKLWNLSSTEPPVWQLVQADTTAALQRPGGVGLEAYLSTSSVTTVVWSYDDLTVREL